MHRRRIAPRVDVDTVERNLYRGSFAALLRVLLAVPIYLILTPFTLKYLHTDQFAVWSFNATIIGIVTLTDLGFKSSLLFHCARNLDDPEYIRRLFGTALAIYLSLWLLTIMVTILLVPQILNLLSVPAALRQPAGFVVIMTVLSFGLRFVAMPFQAVLESHHGVGYTQNVLLLWLIVNAGATLLILPLAPTLYVMGWISLVSNGVVLVAFYRRVVSEFPALGLRAIRFDTVIARRLAQYGAGVYLATIMISFREPLYKIFLSRDFGLAAVTDFEITFRLCTQIISAVMSPLLGTFAAAAVLATRPAELIAVLRPLCGFALFALAPLTVFIVAFADVLVPVWLGQSSAGIVALLPWMFAAFAVYYATEVIYQALMATGGAVYSAVVQTVVIGLCAVGLRVMNRLDHVTAVGLSITAGFAMFSVVNAVCFRRRYAMLTIFAPRHLLAFALPTLICLAVVLHFRGHHQLLVGTFVVYCLLHIAMARQLGIADPLFLWRRMFPKAVMS